MSISNPDIKKLYALSAGRCNLCNLLLFQKDIHIGEMAHIIAKNPSGARGNCKQINDNSYENLILLCPNCHTIVDRNPNKYTVTYLKDIKHSHELSIQQSVSNKKEREKDIDALKILMKYWNFYDLLVLVNTLPEYINLSIYNAYEVFKDFEISFPQYRPFYNKNLENYFTNFWNAYVDLLNVFYEQVKHPEISKANMQVFTQADLNNNIWLNKQLPRNEYEKYYSKLINSRQEFVYRYSEFLDFLKKYYSEVI